MSKLLDYKEREMLLELEAEVEFLKGQLAYTEDQLKRFKMSLKNIANGRDDMNPLFVKKMAQDTLDGAEYNEDPEYIPPVISIKDVVHGPNDPGDEHEESKQRSYNILTTGVTMKDNDINDLKHVPQLTLLEDILSFLDKIGHIKILWMKEAIELKERLDQYLKTSKGE